MSYKNILLGSTLLVLSSCKWLFHHEDPKGMPPISQDGRGTFGCYANGRPFIVYSNRDNMLPNLYLEYYPPPDNGEFHIIATNDGAGPDELQKLQIGMVSDARTGIIELNDTSHSYIRLSINTEKKGNSGINTTPGTNVMPRDTLSHVIGSFKLTRLEAGHAAGTFSFKAWRTGFVDTILVTDGRFDY